MKPNISKIKQEKTIQELLEFSIINVDKPSGPTSFDISDFVRKKLSDLGVKKTSHFGTLDPKVTGVLPIALNRACKLTGFFLGEDKEYVGIMRIHEEVALSKIKKIIEEKVTGVITQMSPVKSRVKRQFREREIKRFEILEEGESENKKDLLFIAEVQGGTYIRKLIDDLGKELEIGAHMLELRRVRAGIFEEHSKDYPSVTLYELDKAIEELKKGNEKLLKDMLIPGEIVSELFEVVYVKDDKTIIKSLFTGKPLINSYIKNKDNITELDEDEKICVFNENRFIGIYKVIKEGEIYAKPDFVLQPLN